MNAPPLSPREVRALRARAHPLKPVVQVGEAGVSEAVVAETERALDDHELIKVRVASESREAFRADAERLAALTGASLVQVIGRVAVLYRPAPEPR